MNQDDVDKGRFRMGIKASSETWHRELADAYFKGLVTLPRETDEEWVERLIKIAYPDAEVCSWKTAFDQMVKIRLRGQTLPFRLGLFEVASRDEESLLKHVHCIVERYILR